MPLISKRDFLQSSGARGANTTTEISQGLDQPQTLKPKQGVPQIFKDAFQTENVIGSYLAQPSDVRQYTSPNNLKETNDYTPFPYLAQLGRLPDASQMSYANSDQEVDSILEWIDTQNRRRNRLSQAGWIGTLGEVSAGISDPTLLLPSAMAIKTGSLVGRVGKGFASGAALTAGAVGIQEGLLHDSQSERTIQESAIATLSGAMFGGIISGVGAGISRGRPLAGQAKMQGTRKDVNSAIYHENLLDKPKATDLNKTGDIRELEAGKVEDDGTVTITTSRASLSDSGKLSITSDSLDDEGLKYANNMVVKGLTRTTDVLKRPVIHGLSSNSVVLRLSLIHI